MPERYPAPLAAQRHTRALVHCLVALQLAQPLVAAAQAAELAPVTAGVSLDQAANGVPVVNIAAPNAAGVSHNQYSAFNVGSEGLILNNSAQPVNTQLGGYITGNAALGAGSARLILNEVTAAAPSQLNGYLEVAGPRAGVVVANPWGISCNGCGFINTSQATLVTGIPLWNSDGSLQGYRVEDGRLRVDGLGLNAGNVDGLALYARVLELNADLYARDLRVVTGANTIDAATGAATALAAGGAAPAYAIDSSALGGMYADTIRLVGTEAGVGMRLAAPVAALTGTLEIRANGDVRLARASAQSSLAVNAAGNLVLADDMAAGGNVTLDAGGALLLADGITLGGETLDLAAASLAQGAGGTLAARADLAVQAAQQDYQGNVGATGSIVMTATSVANSGTVIAGKDLDLTAASLDNQGGQLSAGRDLALHLPAFRQALAGGTLAAQRLFWLDIAGDVVMDGAALELPGGIRIDSATGTLQLDTRLVSGADTSLAAVDVAVGSAGLVAAQGLLTLDADKVSNAGVLFGRQGLRAQVENELINGRSDGSAAGALMSEGNVSITTANGGMLQRLHNYGSSIQSLYGNVTLKAADLQNLNVGWGVTDPYALPSTFDYSINASSFNSFHYCCGRYGEDIQTTRTETRVTRTAFSSTGVRGEILAGGDILIEAGTLLNDHSTISAGGLLDITADSLVNEGTTLYDDIVKTTITRWHTCSYDDWGNLDCWGVQWGPVNRPETRFYASLPAILEGGTDVIIRGAAANGSEQGSKGNTVAPDVRDFTGLHFDPADLLLTGLDPTALPGFQLPGNGLFQLSQDPAHPYLVETNPALNTYQGFLGSAYLLAHIEDWAPGITQRRLGDGYYEITLIRQTLMAVLGSRFVSPDITDEREQFQYLMDNAIAASESLHLSPGIALTREQIDALEADIVWMEERTVAGQQVLVPVVYLAQGSSRLLRDGAVIGGATVAIEGSSFSNSGTVRASGDLRVTTAGDIANQGGTMSAGGSLALQSGGDLSNESGQLRGQDVSLAAAGDLLLRTRSEEYAGQGGSTSYHGTVLGEAASVSAGGSLTLAAGGDLVLEGARVSGNDVSLVAGRDLLLGTVKVADGYRFTSADWQSAEEHVRYLQTEVEAMQSLRLVADRDIAASAAWLRGGSVGLAAGGNIVLASATESDHSELHTQHDGSRSDSSSDEVFDAQRQLGTHIVASGNPAVGFGDVALVAQGGALTLSASTVAAQGGISAFGEQGINVVSDIDTESYSLTTSREGLTRFRNHQEGYIEQTIAQAGFSAGSDVQLDSNASINLAGAGLQSGGLLRLGSATVATGVDGSALRDADGRLVLDRGNVDNIRDVSVTLNNKSWNETQTGYTGPMEELINIGALLASNFNFILTGGQAKLPEISTGSRSSARSESQVAATSNLVGRDILLSAQQSIELQGTALMATGLQDASGKFTGGNVNILAREIALTTATSVTRESESTSEQTTQSLGASTSRGEFQVGGVQIDDRTRTVTTTATTHQGVGIQAANISLIADDTVGLEAAALSADKDAGQIVIDARDIHIDGVQDTVATATEERVDSKSLTVGVRNAFVDAALAADALVKGAEAVKAAKDALDDAKARVAAGTLAEEALGDYERNLAAATAQMAYLELAMGAAAAAGVATTGTGGFYVSGSAQESSTSTITTQQSGLWRGSSLAANDVRLRALDELRLTGASVTANTGVLDAARIELLAGTNTSSQSSTTTTSQQGMTASSSGAALGSIGVNAGSSHASSDATSTQYVNSRLAIGNLTSTSDSLHLAGAVIEADRAAITTGTLTITSLQDTYSSHNSSENHSAGIGFGAKGIAGVSSLSAAMGEGSGYARSRLTGEQSGIIVHDGDASRFTADHTVLTGGLIANATRDADGQLVDQGRLNFVTRTLETQDLVDSSESDQRGFNFGVSLNLSSSQAQKAGTTDAAKASSAAAGGTGGKAADAASRWQPGTLNIGATHTGHRMEGLTLATLGAGNVQVLSDVDSGQDSLAGVNRDIANTRIVTLDQDTHGLNASASVDLRLFTPSGRAEIADEQKNLGRNYQIMGKAMGEGVHDGIETAVMQFDSSEDGRVTAAKIESWVGLLGIIPTKLNNGGIAFGEMPVLLKADDIDQRQMVAATKDGIFMAAHPELGWSPISETEGFYLLTAERRAELNNFMVATVSADLIAADHSLATYQNATTGMMNDEALALYNAFLQTGTIQRAGDAVFTLNYNPTRHILADGVESFVDKVATSSIFGLLTTARPFSFLSTSVAEETGAFLNNVTLARGDAGTNLVCHSQGCLLTYSGMLAVGGFETENRLDSHGMFNITVNMYGSPVNNVAFDNYLKNSKMLLGSSTVNENDFVGEALGGNFGKYIYSPDVNGKSSLAKSQANLLVDIMTNLNVVNASSLFGDSSPHSTYQCTMNCTSEKP